MILRTPSFYKDFKCIAGACPDSCCQGWEVDADEKSLEYYKTLSGEIRQKIDSVLMKRALSIFYKNFLVKRFTNVESIVVVSAKASFSFVSI